MEQPDLFASRATQRRALREITAEGKRGELQRAVLAALRRCGPLTGQELAEETGHRNVWQRTSELARAGLIRNCGTRPCRVTGRTVCVWEVSDGK